MKLLQIVCLFVVLTACTAVQQDGVLVAEQLGQQVLLESAQDPCNDVSCGFGECYEGLCVCNAEGKVCGNTCIKKERCCVSEECGENRECQKGYCVALRKTCNFNEQFSEERAECECVPGTKFCGDQQKCISERSCCVQEDCSGRDEKCTPTFFGAYVCVKDPLAHCKMVLEGTKETFLLDGVNTGVGVDDIQEGSRTLLSVADQKVNVTAWNFIKLGEKSVSVDVVRTFGGTCKES